MATNKKLVITAMTSERLVLDIAELSIPDSVSLDDLVIETRITDEVKTDSAIERYKEEWRKRLPLTTKAMGL